MVTERITVAQPTDTLEHHGKVAIKRNGPTGAAKAIAVRVIPGDIYLRLRGIKERVVEAVTHKYPYTADRFIEGVNYRMKVGNRQEEGEIIGLYAEEDLIASMITATKPGDVLIDIGAAVGTHTIPLAKHLGENGKVIAFEPDRQVASAMQMNLNLNNLTNVQVVQTALWSHDTDLIIHTEGRRGEAPQVTEIGQAQTGKHLRKSARLHARSIDSMISNGNIAIPQGARTIAKIDVEGAGERVLDGMKSISPDIIFMEVHPIFGESIDRVTSTLAQRGYMLTSQTTRVEQLHCRFELSR